MAKGSAAVLPLAALLIALSAAALAAPQSTAPSPLPTGETALWRNLFAAAIDADEDNEDTKAALEAALREQYASAGYGVSVLKVIGCNTTIITSTDGYSPSPDMSPGPSISEVQGLSPVPALAASELQPAAQLATTACYRLNATLYFEPSSELVLNAATGTSGQISDAILDQAGLRVQLYLLNVTVLPNIEQVMYTGDTLLRIPEIGYVSTLWISGPGVVPVEMPRLLAALAAFSLLGLDASCGVVRNKIQAVAQNATGMSLTYLTIVRLSNATSQFPQVLGEVSENGTFTAAFRAAGVPVERIVLTQQTVDNSTTVGAQVSKLLSDHPVVSSFGQTGAPPGISDDAVTASSPLEVPHKASSGIAAGAIAGIAVGAAAAVLAVGVIGTFLMRRRKPDRSRQASLDSMGTLQGGIHKPLSCSSSSWTTSQPSAGLSPKLLLSSGPATPSDTGRHLPVPAWLEGAWLEAPSSVAICQRNDGTEVVLGQGTYGVVYKAVLDGRQDIAIKMLNRIDKPQLEQFRREIELLRSLPRSETVVQFFGACLTASSPFLGLEYMAGGDLRGALSDPRTAPLFDWHEHGHGIALDIAEGLYFLHSHSIIHADLKSKNVLLSGDLKRAKIADVGLSRVMHGSTASSTCEAVGTFSYAAPEQILGYKLTPKVDSFAFSVLLWELITKDPPVRGQLYTVDPRKCPKEVSQLIEAGMARNPTKRPSAAEICRVLRQLPRTSESADEAPQLRPFSIFEAGSLW